MPTYETTSQARRDFLGVSFTALCGGALALNLVLIIALLALIGWQGGRYFWQKDLVEVELADGRTLLGEIRAAEVVPAHRTPDGVERSSDLRELLQTSSARLPVLWAGV